MMKFLKSNLNVILICLFELVCGILLLINPDGFIRGIIYAVSIFLILAAVIDIIKYFRAKPAEAALSKYLVHGLAMLVVGIFCIVQCQWLGDMIFASAPLITIIYGLFIFFTGLGKVQWTVDALRLKTGRWFLHAISAVISFVCASVILADPFTSVAVLWLFIGISLIVEAVVDIVVLFFSRPEAPTPWARKSAGAAAGAADAGTVDASFVDTEPAAAEPTSTDTNDTEA